MSLQRKVTKAMSRSVLHRILNRSLTALTVSATLLSSLASPALAREQNEGGYHPAVPIDVVSRLPYDGIGRKVLVHVPPSYTGSSKVPLVLALHGGGGDIGFAVRMFGFNEKADKEGFIVAYPNGSGRMGDHVLTWNATGCCGYAKARHQNDVGFIRSLLERLETEYNVDKSRVYCVGFSNGAMMVYKLASEMPEAFAAFASVSGSMSGTERLPVTPVPGLIIHGTGDRHVPVKGGGGKLAKWGFDVHAKPLQYCVDFWVNANGCQSSAEIKQDGCVETRRFANGKDGSEVVLCTINGYRHSWPGGHRAWPLADPPFKKWSATDKCWEFFSQHKRESVPERICQTVFAAPAITQAASADN